MFSAYRNYSTAPLSVLVACLACTAALADQDWQGRPLSDYLSFLSEQGLKIVYSSDLVREDYRVLEEPASEIPIVALREVLRPFGLTATNGAGGNLLIVQDPSAAFRTSVIVTDSASDGPVAGATITVDQKAVGQTNEAGRISVAATNGRQHKLSVKASGYEQSVPLVFSATAAEPQDLHVTLRPLQEPLTEIVVSSSMYSLRYEDSVSHRFLERDISTDLPDVGEETLRGIDRFPGVASRGISSRSHVRGGAENEQLIVFDGLRLYEPYHLKDFQSISTIIAQNAIDGIDFYSAGYQARYGDRMSGVVDIGMREPSSSTETELGFSFFNTSAMSTGSFAADGRGDWLFTFRRSNLDLISKAIQPDFGSPRYEDALGHMGWQLSDRTYVAANFLFSYDRISLSQTDKSEEAKATYRNRVAWLKAETRWSDRLSSLSLLSATDIDNSRTGQANVPEVVSGNVADGRSLQSVGFKQDWELNANDTWSFRWGFDVKWLDATYEYDSMLAIASPFDQIFDNAPLLERSIRTAPGGEQYAAYGEVRWRAGKNLVLDLGLRWDRQTYSVADANVQGSPRFNALYRLSEQTEVRFGIGRFYQAQEINELQVGDGISEFAAPQYADHVVGSVLHHFDNDWVLRVEGYRKNYESLIPRFENAFDQLVLIPELQIDRVGIDARSAFVKGVEITLSGGGADDRPHWWAGYTWSSTEDDVGDREFRRSWDQKHSVKAGFGTDWWGWDVSVAGAWHTGWPKTELIVEPVQDPDGSTRYLASTTARNSLDHANFQTLDVRASRTFAMPRGELETYVEISNLYNRRNPCCNQYIVEYDDAGNRSIVSEQSHWLPLVPSIGVVWKF